MKFRLVGKSVPNEFQEPFYIEKFFSWLVDNDKDFKTDFTEEGYYEFYKHKGWILEPLPLSPEGEVIDPVALQATN